MARIGTETDCYPRGIVHCSTSLLSSVDQCLQWFAASAESQASGTYSSKCCVHSLPAVTHPRMPSEEQGFESLSSFAALGSRQTTRRLDSRGYEM